MDLSESEVQQLLDLLLRKHFTHPQRVRQPGSQSTNSGFATPSSAN